MANSNEDSECGFFDATCKAGEFVGDIADGAIKDVLESLQTAWFAIMEWLTTFWIDVVPTPDVQSNAITSINENLGWYTFAFALIGIFFALGKMVLTNDFQSGRGAVQMIVNLIIVTGVYAAGVAACLQATDALAPWLIQQAGEGDIQLENLLVANMLTSVGAGPGLLMPGSGKVFTRPRRAARPLCHDRPRRSTVRPKTAPTTKGDPEQLPAPLTHPVTETRP